MDAETANSDTSNTEKPETGEKSQDTTDVSLKRKLETDETEDDNSSKRAKVEDGEDKELGQEDKAVTEAVEDKMEMAEEDKPAQSESTEEKDEEKASGDHTVEEAASESVAASDSAGLTGEIQEKAAESKDEAAEQKATKSIEKDVEEKEKSKVEEDETKVEKVAEQIGTPSRRKLTRKRVGGEQRKVESAKPASSGEDDKSQMEGSNEDEKFQMDGSKEDEKFQMDGCKEDEKFQMDDSNEDEKFRMDDSKEDEKFQMDGSNEDEKSQMQEEKNGSESGDGDKAASVKSDGGSDKENLNAGTPVDLSNAGTPDDLSNTGTSDIIMLSDEEEMDKQMTDKQLRRWKRIRRLQAALRNEEAKLVLLKKLRQSQQMPPTAEQPVTSNANNVQQVKSNVLRQTGVPPPLVRGSGAQQGRPQHLQQGQNRSSSQQGSMRNVQGPPPLVGAQHGSTNNSNGLASQSAHGLNQHSSSNQRNTQQQQPAVPKAATPPVDTQTPAQRQAAAKLALRKQLEKTLLQIPPPKPPAPEMNFIPSLACPDFVLLLGLEEVVNHIIDIQLIARGQKSPDEKFICNPFTCVQCGTDYTPVWKREKPGSKNVICEHCVTWNQKRALKQEHTNRLKSAFVKALQQEQEIERMQAPAATTTASTSAQSGTPPAPASAPSPAAAAAAAAASNVAAAMSMNSASFRATAEQLRQQQQLLQQAHQAQLRAGQPLAGLQAGFGARGTFPYSLPFVGNLNKADLQRHQQYLLDMIPRGNMPWKH